jgi:type IV pilus assembly protein PilO
MASSGVMVDFARLPTEKKVALFAVIGLLLGLLYWKFFYSSLSDDLSQVESIHERNVAESKRLAADLDKKPELEARRAKLLEETTKQQAALPSEAEVPAFFETLERKVSDSGVEINKWNKKNEEPVESFVKVPVEVEISGTFMQIKRFFASLVQSDVRPAPGTVENSGEEHERIVSIEHLAISNPTVKNREIVLTAKFLAVTYRQEDKPVGTTAPGKPGAAPAKAAPATAPGTPASSAPPLPTAPAPLPPANTPAGAKARAEDAIEKGDARNRNAGGVDEAKTPATGSNRLKGGI